MCDIDIPSNHKELIELQKLLKLYDDKSRTIEAEGDDDDEEDDDDDDDDDEIRDELERLELKIHQQFIKCGEELANLLVCSFFLNSPFNFHINFCFMLNI